MLASSISVGFAAFICFVSARPSLDKREIFSGVATFNDYGAQTTTVCGKKTADNPAYFGAAAGDISPNISGGICAANIDISLCTQGQAPDPSYQGPSCPLNSCGQCYKVTNAGGYGGSFVGNVGSGSVVVQIIDVCPSVSAWNFCKTQIPANERCGDSNTNSLDIDLGAYVQLTGVAWGEGQPNLNINIEPVPC